MAKLTSFPGAVLFGAGLMFFFDPVRGRRRRARVRETLAHAERVERELMRKAVRDAEQRVRGLIERVTHQPSADVPDQVIEQRVRACLGRAVSHPGAIDVDVRDGYVILRGPVLTAEAPTVLRSVTEVPGVRGLIDRMESHDTPGTIPSLQGEGRVHREHRLWSPAWQVSATALGTIMFLYGWFMRRGLTGKLLGVAGGALALRGTVNRPMPELVGRRGGIEIHKTITVHRPIREVFELWSRFDNFPLFMQHVRDVDMELGGTRSRWIVDGPASTKVEFEAETVEIEPNHVIAWRTLPNQAIEHEGRVRFEELHDGTRVHVDMKYRPPGGVIGHAIAHLLGWDPKARMDDDLVRMKALLEDGKTRAHEQHIELVDLH